MKDLEPRIVDIVNDNWDELIGSDSLDEIEINYKLIVKTIIEACLRDEYYFSSWIKIVEKVINKSFGDIVNIVTQENTIGKVYDKEKILQDLQDTVQGKAYYGNALKVAKDFPNTTMEERNLLDKYIDRYNVCGIDDRMKLQDFIIKNRLKMEKKK